MTIPPSASLTAIITKVRRITARPSSSQISDKEIIDYINTAYRYDFPEHLRLEALKVNYQFVTNANQQVYDFPTELYLTVLPPLYIAGYQSYFTQSRENFFRINSSIQFKENSVATGIGAVGPYSGTLTRTPIIKGFKPNPPGALNSTVLTLEPKFINWNVLFTGLDGAGTNINLIDDGQGNLFDPEDPDCNPVNARGHIIYSTGAFTIGVGAELGFKSAIAAGASIDAQYIPYVASRPQSAIFYQDQILFWPIPDTAYTVSFEAFKYPTSFLDTTGTYDSQTPQYNEWWQLLAYMAADKIFSDNADFESMMKFRPLMDEQMKLVQRRTIQQYSSERTASIYTEQAQFTQFPFGNMFGGI
jgi:hypothetical protein